MLTRQRYNEKGKGRKKILLTKEKHRERGKRERRGCLRNRDTKRGKGRRKILRDSDLERKGEKEKAKKKLLTRDLTQVLSDAARLKRVFVGAYVQMFTSFPMDVCRTEIWIWTRSFF